MDQQPIVLLGTDAAMRRPTTALGNGHGQSAPEGTGGDPNFRPHNPLDKTQSADWRGI